MVIFRTTNESYHGHPYPLQTPPNIYRQSIAMYYFTSDITPAENILTEVTGFRSKSHPHMVRTYVSLPNFPLSLTHIYQEIECSSESPAGVGRDENNKRVVNLFDNL